MSFHPQLGGVNFLFFLHLNLVLPMDNPTIIFSLIFNFDKFIPVQYNIGMTYETKRIFVYKGRDIIISLLEMDY